MTITPFHTLLYRYFFYGWLFRDVRRGTVWERSSAWRYNCQQSRWLPTYLRRWGVAGAACMVTAAAAEGMLASPALTAFFYVSSVLAVPFMLVTALAWVALHFNRRPG